jgi:hypothetical protein
MRLGLSSPVSCLRSGLQAPDLVRFGWAAPRGGQRVIAAGRGFEFGQPDKGPGAGDRNPGAAIAHPHFHMAAHRRSASRLTAGWPLPGTLPVGRYPAHRRLSASRHFAGWPRPIARSSSSCRIPRRVSSYPTMITHMRRGPCAPITSLPPISPVREGPEIIFTVRGIWP